MAKLAQRNQIKVKPPLESIARVSLAAHGGSTVQQARAQLCDPSGVDCVLFPE